MSIMENQKFGECLQLAKQASSLRHSGKKDQACQFEKKAIDGFRELISETREFITGEIEKQKKELAILKCKSEYLGKVFCINNGHCMYNPIVDGEQSGSKNFNKDGLYRECRFCGWTNREELFNGSTYFWHRKIKARMPKYDKELLKAEAYRVLTSSEELELVKSAKEFLGTEAKIEVLSKQLETNKELLKEICNLFGHDAERHFDKEEEVYICTCCGKKMDSTDYISSHYQVTYRGGIVPYFYWDMSYIIP